MYVYAPWGRTLRKLNREIKCWQTLEKENRETEVYSDLLSLKREYVSPAIKLYNRLSKQEFIRYSEEQALREKVYYAVLVYEDLLNKYSRAGEGTPDPDADSTALIDVERFTNIEV